MAASVNDKFLKVGVAGTLTSLSAPGHSIAGTSITVGSTTNWPTDTAVIFGIRQVDSNGALVAGTYTEWRGTVSGSTLNNMVLMYGSDQIYPAGSTTQVFIPLSAARDNRLIDGLLVEHDQDGTHGDITAGTGTFSGAISAPSATFSSVTISGTATSQGWTALGDVPDTVTPSATVPRVYDLVFNGEDHTDTLSNMMKLQLTRTVAAPSQCTDLESSSSQYYSRSSANVAAMTFTDDFVVSAWIKLESYATSGGSTIASRFNGTSGWVMKINTQGQVSMEGYNGGGGNISYWASYASVPLNKWTHITAQLDMSTYTPGATDSYCMFDGVSVTILQNRAGTNPTSLVQAGNFEIGGQNGGLQPFDGKIAQLAIYSAKVTQANILATINRGLAGTETSLLVAYSFNGVITDLSANGYTLTANNSAVATNADSPFANGVAAGLLEYAEVLNVAFSTNTTVTVRVPDGCQIPTTGGVSTVLYSTQSNPYGLPAFSNLVGYAGIGGSQQVAVGGTLGTGVDVPGMTVSVYVPQGKRLRLKAVPCSMENSVGAPPIIAIHIAEGSTTLAVGMCASNGAYVRDFTYAEATISPTAGVHTYKVQVSSNNTGSVQLFSSFSSFALATFLSAELV